MAGKLSFSIAINLLTENFKKGTNQVKSALRSMQMQVLTFAAALGAGGIGLSNLASRFIDVARETSRAATALKNVSGSMGQYADNQRYLLDLAKKYGLEINALTSNFAKFTAAASVSNMPLLDQRKIFESVSRACTAFGMSADDSNGVFLALSQMMSKGKISSEELRLQMGERLPVALQAMAKAAGVSVAGLDKLLKQGKLMSKDVLPKFAEELTKMLPNVSTDNLETSVNRLKNTFTELVNSTGVQSKYKALIDWLEKATKSLTDNLKSVVVYAVAAIWVILANKLFNKLLASYVASEKAAKISAKRAARDAGQAFDEVAWKSQKTGATIRMAFSKAIGSLKSMLISFAPTAILIAIGAIVAKLVDMYQEAQRIKSIFSDYKKEVQGVTHTPEIIQLQTLQKLYNDSTGNKKLQTQYQKRIEEIIGEQIKKEQNINDIIRERIGLLVATAKADKYAQEIADKEILIKKIGAKTYNGFKVSEMAPDWGASRGDRKKTEAFKQKYGVISGFDELGFVFGDMKNDLDSYIENAKVLKDAKKGLESNIGLIAKKTQNNTNTNLDIDPDDKKKKSILQKQQESYNKQFEELGAELEIGKITQAEYNKALGELNIKMYAEAKGTGDKETLESDYFKARKAAAEKAVRDMDKNNAAVELEKVQKDYNDKVREVQAQFEKGLIPQKELNESIIELSNEAAKSAAGIKGIGDQSDLFIAAMRLNTQMLSSPVKVKPRDTTFDYKKTKVDIAEEELGKAKEYADKLKEHFKGLGQNISDELANAMAKVPSFEDALKIAQVKQDIKDFTKELNENLYSGIKDIASSSDRMVSSFQNIKEVFNNVDSSGWDHIMAIWNAMVNTVDSFNSIIHTIENISELTKKLSGAQKEQEDLKAKALSNVAAPIAGAIANQIATKMEVEASQRKTEAATAEMAAKSTAAYAGIPFVGLGIAAGQIAAMTAMIYAAKSSVPKFANGGIVTGGPTSGDKIIARVNAGEMILNGRQQSNLFEAINSGKMGGNNHITVGFEGFSVRGDKLELAINNSRKSKGKKPL